MPAPRTVDGTDPAGVFIGVRLSPTQAIKLDQLCTYHGLNRSKMIRQLICDKWDDTPYQAETA